jgi:hypothetical protein
MPTRPLLSSPGTSILGWFICALACVRPACMRDTMTAAATQTQPRGRGGRRARGRYGPPCSSSPGATYGSPRRAAAVRASAAKRTPTSSATRRDRRAAHAGHGRHPVLMQRFPQGAGRPFAFQTSMPSSAPDSLDDGGPDHQPHAVAGARARGRRARGVGGRPRLPALPVFPFRADNPRAPPRSCAWTYPQPRTDFKEERAPDLRSTTSKMRRTKAVVGAWSIHQRRARLDAASLEGARRR